MYRRVFLVPPCRCIISIHVSPDKNLERHFLRITSMPRNSAQTHRAPQLPSETLRHRQLDWKLEQEAGDMCCSMCCKMCCNMCCNLCCSLQHLVASGTSCPPSQQVRASQLTPSHHLRRARNQPLLRHNCLRLC